VVIFELTPSQTVGPYFAIGLPWPQGPDAVAPGTADAITIGGVVLDGAGDPVPDHLLEFWQPDPGGRFADARGHGGPSQLIGFRGFARCGAEVGDGSWELRTVKPGPVPGPAGAVQAPHIAVSVFARGMLNRCVTRIYFADEPDANAQDPVLAHVAARRRGTLLAQRTGDRSYRFDIRLQAPVSEPERETVFFAL
jgi:protocatechuate 3,4-dioxygenase, alpha subunit